MVLVLVSMAVALVPMVLVLVSMAVALVPMVLSVSVRAPGTVMLVVPVVMTLLMVAIMMLGLVPAMVFISISMVVGMVTAFRVALGSQLANTLFQLSNSAHTFIYGIAVHQVLLSLNPAIIAFRKRG
jgi:hypothetical protein